MNITTRTLLSLPIVVGATQHQLPAGSPVEASTLSDAGTEWVVVRATIGGQLGSQKIKAVSAAKYLETVPGAISLDAAGVAAPKPMTLRQTVASQVAAVAGGMKSSAPTTEVTAARGNADGSVSFASDVSGLRKQDRYQGASLARGYARENTTADAARGGDAPMFAGNFTDRDSLIHNEQTMRPLMSSEDAIIKSGLDWTVSKHQLFMQPEFSSSPIAVPGASIMRDDTREVLGIVGPKYEPTQNRDAFKLLDGLRAEGAEFVGAGSFGGGGTVFMQMDLMAARDIVPGDQVRQYIIVRNSHDGSGSYIVKSTPTRAVCWNTLTHASFGEGQLFGRVRHTKGSKARIADIATLIAGLRKQQERAFDTYAALATRPVTDALIKSVFEEIGVFQLPTDPEQVRALANVQEKRRTVLDLFEGKGRGATMPGVAGTAWGLYNAVTEFADWDWAQGSRTSDAKNESRLIGRASAMKEEALEVMTELLEIKMG